MERITVMCDWIVSSECSITLNVDTDTGICRITASIGVVVTPDAGSDFEMLYRNADMALYQEKQLCYLQYGGECGCFRAELKRGSLRMNNKISAKETLQLFCHKWFEQRDAKGAARYIADDVDFVGNRRK